MNKNKNTHLTLSPLLSRHKHATHPIFNSAHAPTQSHTHGATHTTETGHTDSQTHTHTAHTPHRHRTTARDTSDTSSSTGGPSRRASCEDSSFEDGSI